MHQAKGIKSSDAKLRSSEGEFFPGKVLQEARQGKVSDFESSHLFLAQAVFGEHFQQCVIWDSFEVRGTQIPLKGHGKNKTWPIYTWISNILVWAAFLGFQQKRKDAETAQDLHGHTFPSIGAFDASATWDLCGSGFHRAVQQNIPRCLFVGSTKEKIHISASPSETGAAKEQQPCYKGYAQPSGLCMP